MSPTRMDAFLEAPFAEELHAEQMPRRVFSSAAQAMRRSAQPDALSLADAGRRPPLREERPVRIPA